MKNKILGFICGLLVIISFSGCSKKADASSVKSVTRICAAFYPLYVMLLNITEGASVELSMLAPANTGCLHDYQLTTKDMKNISACDILVCCGAGMEDFIEKALEIKKDSVITACDGYELYDDNPHVWVSPSGAAYMTNNITEKLTILDPLNAAVYQKNAEVYIQKLQELKADMHSVLDNYKNYPIITFHEAFPYFAAEFALDIADVIEREPGTIPSAKELKSIINQINDTKKSGKKPALFAEPQYSSSSAEVIASETGLKVYELDPCVTGNLEKNAYLDAMKKNASVISKAFGE